MDNGNSPRNEAAAAYEALNASYRMWDEYMRQGQRLAEDLWMPWLRPFLGDSSPTAGAPGPSAGGGSPFIPPEQWIRAYGEVAMAWMSMAQEWTAQWSRWGSPEPRRDDVPPRFARRGGPPAQGSDDPR